MGIISTESAGTITLIAVTAIITVRTGTRVMNIAEIGVAAIFTAATGTVPTNAVLMVTRGIMTLTGGAIAAMPIEIATGTAAITARDVPTACPL